MALIIKRIGLLGTLVFGMMLTSFAQDRDLTSGSSSGSIRPDVLDTRAVPKTRMRNAKERAELVAEFDSFRGAEALLNTPSFDTLKNDYKTTLEQLAAEKSIVKDLTPLKYLVFELMSRDLAANGAATPDKLADEIMSSYVRTGQFMSPLLNIGMSRSDVKEAERNAVHAVKNLKRGTTK